MKKYVVSLILHAIFVYGFVNDWVIVNNEMGEGGYRKWSLDNFKLLSQHLPAGIEESLEKFISG
jgi:hypothetical protein